MQAHSWTLAFCFNVFSYLVTLFNLFFVFILGKKSPSSPSTEAIPFNDVEGFILFTSKTFIKVATSNIFYVPVHLGKNYLDNQNQGKLFQIGNSVWHQEWIGDLDWEKFAIIFLCATFEHFYWESINFWANLLKPNHKSILVQIP